MKDIILRKFTAEKYSQYFFQKPNYALIHIKVVPSLIVSQICYISFDNLGDFKWEGILLFVFDNNS